MSDDFEPVHELGNPYKLVDYTRENRKGIIACSLEELIDIARKRFTFPAEANLTIVLEQDGTEVDDEEYFATLEKDTSLMVLYENQKWTSANSEKSTSHFIVVDDTDHFNGNPDIKKNKDREGCRIQVGSLVSALRNEPSHISLLAGSDLEMLSDMDPESVADIVSDKLFLEQLKEASNRFIAEKRQAKESMTLLHMFSSNTKMKQT